MRTCSLLSLSLLGLAVALAPGAADADFMSPFCGNTRALGTLDVGIDGTVSFAVIDMDVDPVGNLPVALFEPGLRSDPFDDDARYVYLYQVVNDGPNPTSIEDLTVSLNTVQSDMITSWGHFARVSLSDAQGTVGQDIGLGGNQVNAFGDIDNVAFAEPALANTGVTQPGFALLADLEAPLLVRVSDAGLVDTFKANSDPIYNYNTPNFRSTLVGFTTNAPPGFDTVNFQDGGGQAMGIAASPVPEPSVWVALLSMLPVFGWIVLRGRRK